MKRQAAGDGSADTNASAAWADIRSVERLDERDLQECEACGTPMYGLHCKIVCPNCGYKRDCSDP